MADDEVSSSGNESMLKEKSVSNKGAENDVAPINAVAVAPPPPKQRKSAGGILPKILAIISLLFAIVAVALSAVCTTLWWDWLWVLTAPALALGLTALVLACLGRFGGAAVTAGVICIVLALSAVVWGACELAWSRSYQGELGEDVKKFNITQKLEFAKYDEYGDAEFWKAKFQYETYKFYCGGQAIDWSYIKQAKVLKHDCALKTAKKLYEDPKKEVKGKLSEDATYKGVDSYDDSPIHKTHEKIAERDELFYTELEEEKTARREALDKFCNGFNIDAFVEAREKCDAALEAKFKPKCFPEYETYAFAEGKEAKEVEEVEACKKKGEGDAATSFAEHSKFNLAMGGSEQSRGDGWEFAVKLKPVFDGLKAAEEAIAGCTDVESPACQNKADEAAKKAVKAAGGEKEEIRKAQRKAEEALNDAKQKKKKEEEANEGKGTKSPLDIPGFGGTGLPYVPGLSDGVSGRPFDMGGAMGAIGGGGGGPMDAIDGGGLFGR